MPRPLIAFALLVFSGIPVTATADIIAEVTASNGDMSVIFGQDTDGPHPGAASAGLFEVNPGGSTIMSGNASAGQVATAGGGQSVAFKMDGRLLVAELNTRQRLLESRVVWQDTLLAPAGTSGTADLQFRVDGQVTVESSVSGMSPERWDFLAVAGTEQVSLNALHDPMTSGTQFTPVGWSSLTSDANGNFQGIFELTIDLDTPFDLFLTSSLFAEDHETFLEADLGNTITLTSVRNSVGQELQTAAFASGLSFDAGAAAVPEPSSFALCGGAGLLLWLRRRRRTIDCSA